MVRTILAILFTTVFIATAGAQDRAVQQLIHGKKYFWEAKFDQAIAALKNVINAEDATRKHLFEAYLYQGFVLLRRDAPTSEAHALFEKAIRIAPHRDIDDPIIPPDLVASFEQAKERILGCYYVITEPPDADLMVVNGDSVVSSHKTPVKICELADTQYQLLIKKPGYESKFVALDLSAGATDTVNVALTGTMAQAESESDKGGKFWSWLIRGGVVAGTAAVLYMTVVDEGAQTQEGLLPSPPDRPSTE